MTDFFTATKEEYEASEHVDLVFNDYHNGLAKRVATVKDVKFLNPMLPVMGSYLVVLDPHTTEQCPFEDGDVIELQFDEVDTDGGQAR